MSDTGILLVGFGQRGRQWRAGAAARRGCEVTGVVDPDDRAQRAAAAHGLPVWSSLDDALAATRASAAIVATPPCLHAGQARACLLAGLGVLVEKPIALSVQDAAAVADTADAAGLPAVVGHNFRHRAVERILRRELAAGAIGELSVATIFTARPARAPAQMMPEHTPLWDLGVHHLDLLRLRFGRVPDEVEGRALPVAGGMNYSLQLRWEGLGAADYWLREGATVYHHAEWLEGPRGGLRAVDGRVWLVTPQRRPRRLRPRRAPAPEQVLLGALLSGAGDARDAIGTIAMVQAAIRSLALNRPVRLTGEPGAVATGPLQ